VDTRELLEVHNSNLKNWREQIERMQDKILPKLALRYQVAVVPKRHGNAGPRKTVEEYRLNEPSQQFRKKKKRKSYKCVCL
jgi:hypothetical protein